MIPVQVNRTRAVAALALCLACAPAGGTSQSGETTSVTRTDTASVAARPAPTDSSITRADLARIQGSARAPVWVIEVSDFQCPYCKGEAQMLRDNLIKNYPTQVRLYFKDFPLDMHPWAKAGAIAGRCVFQQKPDAFWEYHDWAFAHQEAITPDNLKDQVMGWGKGAKDIDVLKLGQCIDAKATAAEVEKEIAEGRALDISGTPTIFVNGRRISQTIDWPNLKNIIDAEIEYQKTAKNAGDDCACEIKLDVPGLPSKSPVIAPGKKK